MQLAVAATTRVRFRGVMPSDSHHTPASEQALAIGKAVRALRERGGMTQEGAAEAMGVTRQAWQQYESGAKVVILRTDMQDRLARALELSRDDIIRERDRQAGVGSAPSRALGRDGGLDPQRPFELPMVGAVRPGPEGPELYQLAEEQAEFVDLSWMTGPAVRSLRMAGEVMTGYVESGQLVIYDLSRWPTRGEGCVVELQDGQLQVREYVETVQGMVRVRQRSPEEVQSLPMSDVKGVYPIRFRGG